MAYEHVHKDFHGAMSFALRFLSDRYGRGEMEEYLRRVAKEVYGPLRKRLKEEGLKALEEHWRKVFTLEGAEEGKDFTLSYEDGALVLRVLRCPAVWHIKERGYKLSEDFCETTRIVNEGICLPAGYGCSVDYERGAGRCVQRFWREG